MRPDRWEQVSACLDSLLDRSRAEQAEYLAQLRRSDPTLCAEVESLLESDSISDRLETPPADLLAMASSMRTGLAPSAEAPAPRAAGRFVLHEEIARGGMGAIYRATDPDIDRPLAVKVLLPALRDDSEAAGRFLREARITGQLQHPGVPPIHELGRLEDGTPFFAMKLVEGRTLAAIVRDHAGAHDSHLVGVFEQICRTVAYAHSRGTLHRDLKPNNVMVGAFGEVQVMDWGLAKELGTADTKTAAKTGADTSADGAITRGGEVRGTPAYMAPEQARGDTDDLDERCDVFGLGGILCALLTGQPPFTGSSWEMVQQSRAGELKGAFSRLDRCSADAELIAIARKCLAPNMSERYRDARELAEAVTTYRESARQKLEQAKLDRQTAELQAAEERRRRRLALALGTAILVVMVAGLAAVTRYWLLADGRRIRAESAEALADQRRTQAEGAQALAEERRGQAETAQQNLKKERDRTEETARQARQAVKDSFVLASEHPEFQKDGMQEARRLLLDKALAYFREFATQRAGDAALREDLADAHRRIGFLLADRRQLRDALAEYGRAIELTEQSEKDQPASASRQLELVNLYRLRAGVQLNLGQREPALKSLAQARDHLEPLVKAEPEDFEYRFAAAQTALALGHIEYQEGRLDAALTAYTSAIDAATKLYDAGFKKVKVAGLAAASLVSSGHALKDQRKYADAEKLYARAIKPREDILKAVPGPDARSELARVHGSLALVQSSLDQIDKALASSRRAIELREELVRTNPQIMDYRHALATSYVNIADDLRDAAARVGKFDPEAQRYREKALTEFRALVTLAPEQVSHHHGAAVGHLGAAIGYRRELKQPEKAREHLIAARDIWLDLDKRRLATPEHRFMLAECEKQFGLLFLGLREYSAAESHFRESKVISEKVRDSGYKTDACRCEIARSLTNLAVCAQDTGKLDDALKLQMEALDTIEALAREKPKDAEFQRSAQFTRTNMIELGKLVVQKASTLPKTPTPQMQLQHHQTRAAKWQQLAKRYPKVPEYRTAAAQELGRIASLSAGLFPLDFQRFLQSLN